MREIPKLRWEIDPTANLVNLDPYCHWMLAYGRDFDFNALETIEERGDFSYLAVVDEATLVSKLKSTNLLAEIREFEISPLPDRTELMQRVAAEINGPGPSFPDFDKRPHHVFRLPLRRRSVGEMSTPGNTSQSRDLRFSPARMERAEDLHDGNDLVISAVIDDHVNIAHDRFRTPSGSRIDFAWFQDGDLGGGVPFGREFTRQEIDEVLASADAPTDMARMKKLGLVDFSRQGHNPLGLRMSHGTHVLDLAAGASPEDDATNWRIISVSLPSLVTFETSGAFLGFFFLMGLQYILQRARELSLACGKSATLVINCSYGIAGGPHDGSHIVERSIEELLAEFRAKMEAMDDGTPGRVTVELVLPAGNGNLDRGHVSIAAGDTADSTHPADEDGRVAVTKVIPWRLQPDDRTSSYMEIWFPEGARDVALEIQIPGANSVPLDVSQTPRLLCEGLEGEAVATLAGPVGGVPKNPVGRVSQHEGENGRKQVVIAVAPTAVTDGKRRAAPAGVWSLTVSASLLPDETIEAWVQRDASPIGSRVQGRQSYFDDPLYKRVDRMGRILAVDPENSPGICRRSGTLNGIATGTSPIVVAAYPETEHGRPQKGHGVSPYSGTGTPGGRTPDVAAVSDRTTVRAGVKGAGSISGSRVHINGTSVAAPQVARHLAELAQSSGSGSSGDSEDLEDSQPIASPARVPGIQQLSPETDPIAIRVGRGWL